MTLRRWCDGPVTVEGVLTRPCQPPALATVLPLHRNRPRTNPDDGAQPALNTA